MLDLLRLGAERLGDFGNLGIAMRQEFMQRRIEQTDRDRQALHDLEQFGEVAALHRQDLRQRRTTGLLGIGEDHLAHRENAVSLEEHVFGAAKPDPLGAELECGACIRRRIRIGAHAELAHLVGPRHQRAELAGHFRLDHLDLAEQHLAGRAIDGDDVAALQGVAGDRQGSGIVIDADRTRARDAGLAHAARHHRRMRGHAAACGEDAFRGMHAVNVFRTGLDPHQNDLAALLLERFGILRGEHDLARRSARRRRQAGGDDLALRLRVDGRMQQLIERARIDAHHRFVFA